MSNPKMSKNEEYEKRIEFLEKRLEETNLLLKDIMEKGSFPTSLYYGETRVGSIEEQSMILTKEEQAYAMIKIILESLPFPVFIKDENCRYLLVNSFEAQLFGLTEEEIIGKEDAEFVKDKEEIELIKQTDFEAINRNRESELPNQSFTLSNGRSYIFKTYKIPFQNPVSGKPNIFGFSIDVTDSINLNNLRKFVFNKMG